MIEFFLILLAGIGTTNLVVNSTLLESFREFLLKHINLLGILFSCMMCTGFWVGIVFGLMFGVNPLLLGPTISLLSYLFGEILEYLILIKAIKSQEISEIEDE